MIIHEFGHFIIAKKFGVRVDEFGIGYPPRLFGKQVGETFYSVNLIPLGAFVKIRGEEGGIDDVRSFTNLAMWKRMLIVLGGVIAFWIAAIIIFSVLFGIGASVPVGDEDIQGVPVNVVVTKVAQDSPADLAGLKPGDMIGSFSGAAAPVSVDKISDFQNFIKSADGKPITITVKRQGEELHFDMTPRVNPPAGQGATGLELDRLAEIIKKYPWYWAPIKGLEFTWEVTVKSLQGIIGFFAGLFTGAGVPAGAELAGPIGITIFLANAASYGLGFFLYFIGSISVLVAIFNLFPIPALDGGKMVFLIIEKVLGKAVPVKWEQGITVVCFLLLILMSIFVTIKFDIRRVCEFSAPASDWFCNWLLFNLRI